MPASTRKKIELSLASGGELVILSSILGRPRFVGMLFNGPNGEPVKILEIVPSETLRHDVVSH
jgi:hypothetical protein